MKKQEMIKQILDLNIPEFLGKSVDRLVFYDIIYLIVRFNNLIINTETKDGVDHYKFWTYTKKGDKIKYVWGRIGSEGKVLEKEESEWDARSKMNKKIEAGYKSINWS